MARRSYNPNTKSGRRNIRNQYHENYANKTPEEKDEHDSLVRTGRIILFVIVIVVCLIVIAMGGKIK